MLNLVGTCSDTILSQWFNWNIKAVLWKFKEKNINNEKYIPLLKSFSKNQLRALFQNQIITEETLNLLIPKNQFYLTNSAVNNINSKIEEIISGDKIKEFQELLQEKDIKTFNTITKSFLEVELWKN